MNGKKSDTAIVLKKTVKADGEKAVHLIASSDKQLCRRKRTDEHGKRVTWKTGRFMNRRFIKRTLGFVQTGTAIR